MYMGFTTQCRIKAKLKMGKVLPRDLSSNLVTLSKMQQLYFHKHHV